MERIIALLSNRSLVWTLETEANAGAGDRALRAGRFGQQDRLGLDLELAASFGVHDQRVILIDYFTLLVKDTQASSVDASP